MTINTQTNKLTGSWVALVTPMLENGEVDFESLKDLIDWHVESKTDGLVILGTTGESSLVSDDEFFSIVDCAVKHSENKIPLVIGCAATATDKNIALAKKLAQYPIEGLLCVTPYYIKPSQKGLIAHFTAIADAVDIPVILYNVPSRTGVDLHDDSVFTLAKHKNIVGIKDATGDIERFKNGISQIENFVLLSGDDLTALDFIKAGGHGTISVTANVAPKVMSDWINLALSADENVVKAETIFNQLMPTHQNLFLEANPIPVKWALERLNRIKSGIRLPLTRLSNHNQIELEKALFSSQIIN